MAALSNSPVQLWASPATGELPWQHATGAKGLKASPAFQSDFKSNLKLYHSMVILSHSWHSPSFSESSSKAPVFTTLEDLAMRRGTTVHPAFHHGSLMCLCCYLNQICSVFSSLFSSLSKRLRSTLSLCTSSWGCKLP